MSTQQSTKIGKLTNVFSKNMKNNVNVKNYSILLILIGLCTLTSILSDRFLTAYNIINVTRQVSITAIVACGMTLVILSGGIDLSVAAIMAFSGCTVALLLNNGWGVSIVVIIGIFSGLLPGLLNGLIISKWKVPPFIATLAMMTLLRGISLLMTNGYPVNIDNWKFVNIGTGHIFSIPIPIFIMIGVFIIIRIILYKTRFGIYIYAIGGNAEAAKFSGINVNKVLIFVYSMCGLLAGLGGTILAARITSGQPTAAMGFELDVIAAVIVGGISLSGGEGKLIGTIIGAFILGVLSNAMNLLGILPYWQYIVRALVILLAISIDMRTKG